MRESRTPEPRRERRAIAVSTATIRWITLSAPLMGAPHPELSSFSGPTAATQLYLRQPKMANGAASGDRTHDLSLTNKPDNC